MRSPRLLSGSPRTNMPLSITQSSKRKLWDLEESRKWRAFLAKLSSVRIIITCKRVFSIGSDTLLCIAENRAEIMKMIPNAMKDMKNLNDLTRMDDFLHLLQYMIKFATDAESGKKLLRRVCADPHVY